MSELAATTVTRLRPLLAGAAERLRTAPVVPVLGALVLVQLAIAAFFAFRTPHNGFIFYSGGDATEYWTEQWAVAHGIIPQATLGYFLPVFYAWVPLVAGPSLLTGAAVIVPLQAVVFVSAGVVCLWGLADQLYGRLFAWWSTLLYIVGPLLLLRGFVPSYHAAFDQYFLAPHWYGLTNMGDLPSTVILLGCAWATVRAYDTRSLDAAVVAGLLGGAMIGVKPSTGYFVPAVVVLLAGGRRWRELVTWVVCTIPSVFALTLWKARGLGTVPLLSASGAHEAAGRAGGGLLLAAAPTQYLQFNGHHLSMELSDLREVFWSVRLLEFIAIAGLLAALRRRPSKGLFLGVWCFAFLLVKGSTPLAEVQSGNYWRLAEPGLPGFVLLAASLVFLWPGVRAQPSAVPARPRPLRHPRALAALAVVLGLVPIAAIAAAAPASSPRLVRDNDLANEAPLSSAFDLHGVVRDGKVRLSWRKPAGTAGAQPSYIVFRSETGDGCSKPDQGSYDCMLAMDVAEVTGDTSAADDAGHGTFWYRVALTADYHRHAPGDLMLVSPAVRVRLP